MSDEISDVLLPQSGKLGQLIFENPGAGIEPRLEFFVEIGFGTIETDEGELSPILRLNNILTGAKSWRELAGQKLEFPYHPKPGSIDAGVHLFHVQNPADVTALQFGEMVDGKMSVSFGTEIDFEIEADSEWGQVEISVDLALEIGPLRVATSIEKRHKGDLDAITSEVASLVDLGAYESLEKVSGGFEFPSSVTE